MSNSSSKGAFWVGPGELEHPDDGNHVHALRDAFLAAIAVEEPRVLQGLATDVLPCFRPVWTSLHDIATARGLLLTPWLAWTGDLEWPAFLYASKDDTARQTVRAALEVWARHWHLDESDNDWILTRALHTMSEWCAFPHLLERAAPESTENTTSAHLGWSYQTVMRTIEVARSEIVLTLPQFTWHPQWERRADARQRIYAAAQEAITAELDRIEALARSRGLESTQRFNSGDAHFRWLAAYQVRGQDWADIGRRFGQKDPGRVQKDALKIAKTIGIKRRPGRSRGRPRGGRRPRIIRRSP